MIGICGGIGSGKSAVSAEFGRQGCVVIDSDRLGHAVLAEPEVVAELVRWWGPEILAADGRPDRRRVAERVFDSGAEKRRLESLVHPLIARRRADIIQRVARVPAVKAIIVDSPLLLERNLDHECDVIVFVNTSDLHRLQRLEAERGWTAAEVARRERWQMPLADKRRRADFVVENDGPAEALCQQVADILQAIAVRDA